MLTFSQRNELTRTINAAVAQIASIRSVYSTVAPQPSGTRNYLTNEETAAIEAQQQIIADAGEMLALDNKLIDRANARNLSRGPLA